MTVYEVCPTCGRAEDPGYYWVFPSDWVPVPPWWRLSVPPDTPSRTEDDDDG